MTKIKIKDLFFLVCNYLLFRKSSKFFNVNVIVFISKRSSINEQRKDRTQKILEEIPDEEPEEPKTEKSIERLKQVQKKVIAIKPAPDVYKPKFKFIN